jgi:hypothetical protein
MKYYVEMGNECTNECSVKFISFGEMGIIENYRYGRGYESSHLYLGNF